MDPKRVKLTFRQTIGPTLKVVKKSSFVLVMAIAAIMFCENAYVAHLMPTLIVGSPILSAVFSFGLALIVQVVAALPFFLFIGWWIEGEDGGESGYRMYRKFCNELNSELLVKKEEVLKDAEQEMLK